MDKKDWKEAQRREKAAAAAEKTQPQRLGESKRPSPQPLSSSSGAGAQASTGDVEENAYPPEMDEMRCFLWAHGGRHPDPLCSGAPRCLQSCSASHRGLLFWEREPGKVRGHAVLSSMITHLDWNIQVHDSALCAQDAWTGVW